MAFIAVMAVIVLVLLGAIAVLAGSATGRLDRPGDDGSDSATPSSSEVAWSAATLVVGLMLCVFGFLGFAVGHNPAWLGTLLFGLVYVYKGAVGLRV